MEKRTLITILSLTILIIIGAIIYTYFFQNPYYSELTCETILENKNPSENINIVFFANKIKQQKIQEYIDAFQTTAPFSENQAKFNFYQINANPNCEINSEYSAILCYSRDLIKMSAVCPNDYIVVIEDHPRKIRSSTYMNVVSINANLPKVVLMHEFGHVFANLADEYVPAQIPLGSKNCAKDCEKFQGIGSCHKGCSKSEYYRSSPASIMKTLSSNSYEQFNEKLIKQKIDKY